MNACPQCGSAAATAGACVCGWRSAAAVARLEQTRLPLGDDGPDWREQVQASLARHRQRRSRLLGAAAADEPEAENIVPFRRPAMRRIPVVAVGATTAASTALVATASSAAAAPAMSPEPVAEPIEMAPPPRVLPPLGVTLPLPFAPTDGHVEIAAPLATPRTETPPASGLVRAPAAPARRLAAGLEDVAWSAFLAAVSSSAAWVALGAPPAPHFGASALRLAGALVASLLAFWWLALSVAALASGTASPGMRRQRLSIVGFDGQPADRAARLRRVSAGIVSMGALGLGYFWMLLDPEQLTWHDHLSRTVVTANASETEKAGRSPS